MQDWKLFDSFAGYMEERREKLPKAKEMIERKKREIEEKKRLEIQENIEKLKQERTEIQAIIPTLKGLFSAGKRNKLQERLAQIENELHALSE